METTETEKLPKTLEVFAIVNFEAQEVKDIVVRAFFDKEQARSEFEKMQIEEHLDLHRLYAGEIISFRVIDSAPVEYKILNRLKTILSDYEKVGFENSAGITKYIISEIEEIVKL